MRATDIARAMVTEYGMSEAIGPVNHDRNRRNPFLETPFAQERGTYAEDTARVIDAEIKRIIEIAQADARTILSERRPALDTLSERLLVKEVIEGEELRQLIGPVSVTPPMPA